MIDTAFSRQLRVKVNDPDQYKKYADQVPAILAKHGGKVLARGGRFQIMEGPEKFDRFVVIEFPTFKQATSNIPPERVRIHLCWGNYEGPHHCDVPLADIIDIAFAVRANGISFEAANPRHGHEWALFEIVKLPPDKVLIPGVVELKSNFVEHPELIANRIGNYAKLVGRENVIAGSDCGFGTWVGQAAVDPDAVWAKFTAMAEGARIASKRFWS